MINLINIESLDDFVSLGGINSYDGRVKYVLKFVFNQREYLMFNFLCNELFIDTFIKRYNDRIIVKMVPLSSNPYQHYIEIDGRPFFLVGNDEQFNIQFKGELRDRRINNILDNEEE